jgi:hypothetical protein
MNLYQYVGNSPVDYTDPFGLKKIKEEGGPYYFHPNDADDLYPHVHVKGPNSPYKVNLNTGEHFYKNTGLGKFLNKKILNSILGKIPVGIVLTIGLGLMAGDSWADIIDPFSSSDVGEIPGEVDALNTDPVMLQCQANPESCPDQEFCIKNPQLCTDRKKEPCN